ncbi:MAG: protease modulator HflC [Rickettsiaceae bacterium]|nr:protease modulator HflC [Rickettsiaceae bacterium]
MYNQKYIIITSTLCVLVLTLISFSVFTIEQRQRAVVFQFGEAVKILDKPGIGFKVPFIQNVHYFDKRILHVEVDAKELTATDGKRVIVDAFAKFRIEDPIIFYKTVYNLYGAHNRINRILEAKMRDVIGKIELTSLLSPKRKEVMDIVKGGVAEEARQFGIEVVDVRILRADLPKENSAAIYGRMQTEREKEARQIRAEGYEEAAIIRSKAEKESKIIIAEAYKNAEIIKGEGEAQSTKIYNDAFGRDVDFYSFIRYLQAYETSFNKPETTIVLSPNSKFLSNLNLGD